MKFAMQSAINNETLKHLRVKHSCVSTDVNDLIQRFGTKPSSVCVTRARDSQKNIYQYNFKNDRFEIHMLQNGFRF